MPPSHASQERWTRFQNTAAVRWGIMAKLPKLNHVKYVRAKGRVYAYFNTGKTGPTGKAIYTRLPHPSEVGFYDSYAAMKGARTKRTVVGYLVSDLVRDYEIWMEARKDLSNGSKETYRSTNKRVVELLGEFPVNDVQVSDVRFMLENKMPGAGSHNIFLAMIRNLYKWARKEGKTVLDPAKDLKAIKGGEHDPWPEDILNAGLEAKDDRTRLAVNLLYYTGQRIGDVIKMRWDHIHDGEIHVLQEKNDKEVSPPIHSALADVLAATPRRGATIIASAEGDPYSDETIRTDIKNFTRNMGKECVPHGLRKNAVIALLEAGCTIAEVASITGQSFRIVEHYARKVNRRRLGRTAMTKLENKTGLGKEVGKLSEDSL